MEMIVRNGDMWPVVIPHLLCDTFKSDLYGVCPRNHAISIMCSPFEAFCRAKHLVQLPL